MFTNLFLLGAGISFIILIVCIILSNKLPHYIPTLFLILTIGLGIVGGYLQLFGKTCGNCGMKNYAFADRCMGCGHLFLTRCANCGTALADSDVNCPLCGRSVNGQGRTGWGAGGQIPT